MVPSMWNKRMRNLVPAVVRTGLAASVVALAAVSGPAITGALAGAGQPSPNQMNLQTPVTEVAVAIEEWLKRIPVFRIEDEQQVRIKGGSVGGVERLPLVWN